MKNLFPLNVKNLLAFTAFFVLLVLGINACQQEEQSQPIEVKYNLKDKVYPNAQGAIRYCAFLNEFEEFKSIAEQLGPLKLPNSKVVGIVFYYNKTISSSFSSVASGINPKSINSFSLYYIDAANVLNHCAYFKNGENFERIKDLDLKTNNISTNSIIYVRERINSTVLSQDYYLVIDKTSNHKIDRTDDELELKVGLSGDIYSLEELASCRPPCEENETGSCNQLDNTEEWWCEPKVGCLWAGSAADNSVKKEYSPKFINKYLNLDLYREFRENFLKKTPVGRKFIRYNEALGDYLQTSPNYNTKLILNTIKYIPNVYNIISKINDSNNSKEIIISEEDKRIICQVLADYKKVSVNEDYQKVIGDIEKEIKAFSGKNKNELLAYLNSVNH